MEKITKFWNIAYAIIICMAFFIVGYKAICVESPTNNDLADMIFFSLIIILWQINNKK
jgi:hypothetical protein